MGRGSGITAVTCRCCVSLSGQNTRDPRESRAQGCPRAAGAGATVGTCPSDRRVEASVGLARWRRPLWAEVLGAPRTQPSPEGVTAEGQSPCRGGSEPRPSQVPLHPLARRALRGREEEGQSGNCLEENWVYPVSALDRLWAQGPEARGWGVRGDGDLEGSPGRAARVLAWRRCPRGLALAREGPGHSRGSCKRAPLLARAWKAPPTTEALAGASAHPWRPGHPDPAGLREFAGQGRSRSQDSKERVSLCPGS